MNINLEIFKRYQPEKKIELINKLTDQEVRMLSMGSIIRIIKEVGTGSSSQQRNANKNLRLQHNVGNSWNSTVDSLSYYKKKLYIYFYLQYDNTDTTTTDIYENFIKYPRYNGSYQYSDRYGGTQTTYYVYDESDKAKILREFLLTYVNLKYKDKLNNN